MTDKMRAPQLPPPGLRALCRVDELADGATKAFQGAEGSFIGLFAVCRGNDIHVYVNACPHIGTPLDWVPGRFLSADGSHIVCATHGALFRIEDGLCTRGPCVGDLLERVSVQIDDGVVYVPALAGA